MQRNLTPCLAGLSVALWSLAAVMITTYMDPRILIGVIGLAAATSTVTGIALVQRITDEERRQLREEGRRDGYRMGSLETARALVQGANVSVMPRRRSPRGSTHADPRFDAHDPQA